MARKAKKRKKKKKKRRKQKMSLPSCKKQCVEGETRRVEEEPRRLEEEIRRIEENTRRIEENTRRINEETRRISEEINEETRRIEEYTRRINEETRVSKEKRLEEEARRVELSKRMSRLRLCERPITSAWQKVLDVPDTVFASGVVRVLPSVRFAADNALIDVTDVNALKQRMVPSTLGKNDEDVFDPLSRLSFETADIAVDEWPELPLMLERIASQLHLTVPLTAHVGKLLLYETGGFFRRHRDSEHRPGHFLSVVVDLGSDCSGGRVVFDLPDRPANYGGWVDGVRPETERDLVWPEWQSQTRAWACWFASSYHRVEPLTAGHRVVLTFDVTVELPASSGSASSSSLYPASRFEGVAPFHELVWQSIAAQLRVADRAHLSQTCRDLHAMIGGTPKLLCGHLMQMNAQLVNALREEHFVSMAFACRHFYLFNNGGDSQTMSPLLLKGRDRAIAEALRLCGWRVSVQRAVLQEEVVAGRSFCEGVRTMISRVRIGCDVLTQAEAMALINCNESYDAVRARISQIDPMVMRVHRRFGSISRTAMEANNSVSAQLVMPFSGVFFCETLPSLRTMARSDLVGESQEMYGNHAFSKLMRYETCIVRADKIYDDDVPDELYCAHDVQYASKVLTRNAVILRSVFL
jgi:hypothetical protein